MTTKQYIEQLKRERDEWRGHSDDECRADACEYDQGVGRGLDIAVKLAAKLDDTKDGDA